MNIEPIARIRTPFPEKFGIPRQSGLAPSLKGEICFEEKYSVKEAVEGLEGYDYIWLIWEFELGDGNKEKCDFDSSFTDSTKENKNREEPFRAKIRPPRLGGNTYMGVFATRSPFRPNRLGLSCVKLEGIEYTKKGPVIHVTGADLRDNTPIYDIKPYIPYADAHPDARGGFTENYCDYRLEFEVDANAVMDFEKMDSDDKNSIKQLLSEDPRPAYHKDPNRIYGMKYCDLELKFKVEAGKVYLLEIQKSE